MERGVLPQGGISITEQTFLMCYFCIEETFAMYRVMFSQKLCTGKENASMQIGNVSVETNTLK